MALEIAFLEPRVYVLVRGPAWLPQKLGTQTFRWVRVTVLGSGERQLWGGSETENG